MNIYRIVAPAVLLFLLIPASPFAGDIDTPNAKTAAAITQTDTPVYQPEQKVIAYYFHRTWRCETCLTIEAYAEETVKTRFADRLADGRLEWRAVDFSVEENEHYEDDFKLEYHSLILSDETGKIIGAWKNLENVWDLVDEKEKFQEYVFDELTLFLGRAEKRMNEDHHTEKTDE